MSILHLCNTYFEDELAGLLPSSLEEVLTGKVHPVFLQLQFLPLVYRDKGEKVVISSLPDQESATSFTLLAKPEGGSIESWGPSLLIEKWAHRHHLDYTIPPWEVVKRVNAKTYSFEKSPLPEGRILESPESLPDHFVLKSCFGTAGRGHCFVKNPKSSQFCEKEWRQGRPVIAEPWVERTYDFSTQWIIHSEKEVEYVGATECITSSAGTHLANRVGRLSHPEAIEDQKGFVLPILKEMGKMGFFGHVGIDGMLYQWGGKIQLQPVVEINGRKTMGWVALKIHQKRGGRGTVIVSYETTAKQGLLPRSLGTTQFMKNLYVQEVSLNE